MAALTLALYLADADSNLRTALVSASPGELIGPVERADGHMLLQVLGKIEPGVDDPELERRAGALLSARAIERELRNRVQWHDRP